MDPIQEVAQRHLQLRRRQVGAHQHGKLVAAHAADEAVPGEALPQHPGRLPEGPVPLGVAMGVVDRLEAVQIHHDEVPPDLPLPLQGAQGPAAGGEKGPAGHGAGEGVLPPLLGHAIHIPPVQRQKQHQQRHHGEDPEEELHLQVEHVGVAGVREGDAVDLQHVVHAVDEVERHRQGEGQGQGAHRREAHPVAGALPGLHGLIQLQPPPEPGPPRGVDKAPDEQHHPGGGQIGQEVRQREKAGEGVAGAVAALREEEAHGAVDQQGVDGPPQEGHRRHPHPGPAQPPGRQVQKPRRQAEEHPGPHAEDHAPQRVAAVEGGEELVRRHDVAGRGLPHAGKAEHRPHGGGGAGADQRPGQQHREKGGGDGEGLDMDIAEKGEGHQEFHGDEGPKGKAPQRAAGPRRARHMHFLLSLSALYGAVFSGFRGPRSDASGESGPFPPPWPGTAPGPPRCTAAHR